MMTSAALTDPEHTVEAMRQSLIDRVTGLIDRLPLPAWSVYLAAGLLLVATTHAADWACSAAAVPRFSLPLAMTSIWSVLSLAAIHHTQVVGRRALESFRPALEADALLYRRLLAQLMSAPPISVVLALGAGVVYMLAINWLDPTFFGLLAGRACPDSLVLFIGWINTSMILTCSYRALRVLFAVTQAHDRSPRLDLFQRPPLFAFSLLTSRIALLIAALSYLFFVSFPTVMANPLVYGYLLIVSLPLSLLVFLWPLQSVHRRMVEEKERLRTDVGLRIKVTLENIHRRIDTAEGQGIDELNRLLSTLILEEQYIQRMQTWPWEPGTLTGVLTGLFLPLVAFSIQRVVAALLG